MSTYFVISDDIVDSEPFQNDAPRVADLLGRGGGGPLVSDTGAELVESERDVMHVIIRFPSKAAARACFDSDEDQCGIKHFRRNFTTDTQVALASGFEMPVTAGSACGRRPCRNAGGGACGAA